MMYAMADIGKEFLGMDRAEKLRKAEFWALDNVSLSIAQGESVGLVGSNGAGKSTLLRVLSGLIKPDRGTVQVRGRVAPLIALGAGFNPVLSGKENIYVNMAILGLSKREVDKAFDAVVDFAELGHAIDMPVQSYSSGMAARLGFACAVFTSPDILLIDEVLAVGDIKFRLKCYRKLASLKQEGTSFILVSHSAQSIVSICDSAIYLAKGKVISRGPASEVTSMYENELLKRNDDGKLSHAEMVLPEKTAANSSGVDILSIGLVDRNGERIEHLVPGEEGGLAIRLKGRYAVRGMNIKMIIRELSFEGATTVTLDSTDDNFSFDVPEGICEVRIALPHVSFKPGLYTAKFNINTDDIHMYDAVESFIFKVQDDHLRMVTSTHFQQRNWRVVK